MAIAHDATTAGTEVTSGTTQTISHTTGSLTNGFVKVGVAWDTTGGLTISGVTYNGNALSSLTQSNTPFASKAVQIWYGVNPASGAHDAVITCSGTIVGMNAHVSTYSGVDQGSPVGTVANGADFTDNTTPISASPGSTSDGLVIDAVYTQIAASVGAGQTQRANDEETWTTAGSDEAGTGSAVAMTWSQNSLSLWAATAVNLNNASASPVTIAPGVGGDALTGRTLSMGLGVLMPDQAMGITGRLFEAIDIRASNQILISPA